MKLTGLSNAVIGLKQKPNFIDIDKSMNEKLFYFRYENIFCFVC